MQIVNYGKKYIELYAEKLKLETSQQIFRELSVYAADAHVIISRTDKQLGSSAWPRHPSMVVRSVIIDQILTAVAKVDAS